MKPEIAAALEHLFSSGADFDKVIAVLESHRAQSVRTLAQLLVHPDPGWRTAAATALARLRTVPPRCLPDLLRLLKGQDAMAQVAAIAAIESLPPAARDRAVPALIALLHRQPAMTPAFTRERANVPRIVAAHCLGRHGGPRGLAALRRAARRRGDPIVHHVDAALVQGPGSTTPDRRRRPRPNSR
jgi:hypothetical protein